MKKTNIADNVLTVKIERSIHLTDLCDNVSALKHYVPEACVETVDDALTVIQHVQQQNRTDTQEVYSKVAMIKAARDWMNDNHFARLGLKEAKDMVEYMIQQNEFRKANPL